MNELSIDMPHVELTLRLAISEESLEELRAAQETGEFGAEQAMVLLHDSMPTVTLLHVDDQG